MKKTCLIMILIPVIACVLLLSSCMIMVGGVAYLESTKMEAWAEADPEGYAEAMRAERMVDIAVTNRKLDSEVDAIVGEAEAQEIVFEPEPEPELTPDKPKPVVSHSEPIKIPQILEPVASRNGPIKVPPFLKKPVEPTKPTRVVDLGPPLEHNEYWLVREENDIVPIAASKEAYDLFFEASAADDVMGIQHMLDSGLIATVSSGTRVLKLSGIFTCKVRVLAGDYKGMLAWVANDYMTQKRWD